MGHTRVAGATAATAAVLLLCPALAACTSAMTTRDNGSARATGAPQPTGTTPDSAAPAVVDALATGVTSAVSSAATRAASVAATAARSAARSRSHSAPLPSTRPSTHAPPPAPASAKHPAPVASGDSALESEVLSMINQERAANGLAALRFSAALTTSARRHSAAMAGAQQLSHQLPGEADLIHREAAAGYHGSAWAENVGETPQGDENGAVGLQNLLYGDPPHRANILSTSMHAVGVGIVIDSRGQLWLTEDFGG